MDHVFSILLIHIILGGGDHFWRPKWQKKLPVDSRYRRRITLCFVRYSLDALLLFGLVHYEWHGNWAILLVALLGAELMVRIRCSYLDDKARKRTFCKSLWQIGLAANMAALLLTISLVVLRWGALDSALIPINYGMWSVVYTAFFAVFLLWGMCNNLPRQWGRVSVV